MGLLQRAVETYDCNKERIGVYLEDHMPLAPAGHMLTRASLEIVINANGDFLSAMALDKKDPRIIIPVTEESSGRTGGACPHPLCEQIGYLVPYNTEKYENYLAQLQKWITFSGGNLKLRAVYQYVKKGEILSDLQRCGLLELKENGTLEQETKDGKKLVRWRIFGLNDGAPEACWEDKELFDSFQQFYSSEREKAPKDFCMVSGEYLPMAKQHIKGIVPLYGNAKLISANDNVGYTYRGRFLVDTQAATVSFIASQKAHNALSWLVGEQGVICGGRVFLCWNPQGHPICHAAGAFAAFEEPVFEPTDYRKQLQKTLTGYRSQFPDTATVVIAAFDAATTGRLSLTYYSEFLGADFLQRLYDWDNICCWYQGKNGIASPPLRTIVNDAFGVQRVQNGYARIETDDRVLKQQMQRLMVRRLERGMMPEDIVVSLFHRASFPQDYDPGVWRGLLSVACAVIRKYRYDKYKEEWSMVLEPEKKDLSYQYGRLLAVLEKVERDTYGADESREPNAIRLMSVFCRRPLYTANQIEKQLERAYFPRLSVGSRTYYKNLIGSILEQIHQFPQAQWNLPLKETYLMGYYLQRSALYTSRKTETTEQTEE